MSRDDVFNAANDIRESGQRPSILGVYKLLGRGSYTTISNHLKQWEEENKSGMRLPTEVELPEMIATDADLFVRKLWNVAKNYADEQVQSERDALRQRELELQDEMRQAVDMANDSADKLEAMEEKLAEQKRERQAIEQALQEKETALALKSAAHDRALRDVEKLENENQELGKKLEVRSSEISKMDEQCEALRIDNREMSQKVATMEGELETQKYHNVEQAAQSKALAAQVEQLQAKLDAEISTTAELKDTNATLKAEGEGRARELTQAKKDLAAAQAEAKQLIQEKGILTGQIQEKEHHAVQLEKKLNAAMERPRS